MHVIEYLLLFLSIQSLLSDDQVASAPVLILGNKIDRPGAASEEELKTYFNLHGQITGKVGAQRSGNNYYIKACSSLLAHNIIWGRLLVLSKRLVSSVYKLYVIVANR